MATSLAQLQAAAVANAASNHGGSPAMTDPRLQVTFYIPNTVHYLCTSFVVSSITLFSTPLSFFLMFDLAHWMFQNLAAAGLAGIRNAHSGAFGGIHAAQPGQAGHLPVNTAGLSLQAQAVANQTAAYAGALPAA